CLHQLLVKATLVSQLRVVFSLHSVSNEGVVERDQITTRAVKWISEPARLTGDGPTCRADCLNTIMREILQCGVVQHSPIRQVAREEWKLLAYPFDQLRKRINLLARNKLVVVDETETGLSVQGDGPKPKTLIAEVIRGLPCGRVAQCGAIRSSANLLRREVSKLLDVEESVDPEEVSAVADGALACQSEPPGEEPSTSRSVDHPGSVATHCAFGGFERK